MALGYNIISCNCCTVCLSVGPPFIYVCAWAFVSVSEYTIQYTLSV